MVDAVVHDRAEVLDDCAGPVVLEKVFTPKPGQLSAFVDAQIGEYRRFLDQVAGWIGNRIHLSLGGSTVVNYGPWPHSGRGGTVACSRTT